MTPEGATSPTPSTPESSTIDLDAARAARAEQRRKDGREGPPVVRFLGQDWPLPVEIPAETVHAFGALAQGQLDQIGPGVESLFGPSWEKIVDAAKADGEPLSWDDEVLLLERAFEIYGIELPESLASAPS